MFKKETALVRQLQKLIVHDLPELTGNDCVAETKIMKEVNLGHGIADLVAINYDKTIIESGRNQVLNPFDLNLLNIIRKNEYVSYVEISNILRTSNQRIRLGIEKLRSENLINITEGDCYVFRSYQEYFKDIIAVEAKLKDWKGALNQAYRYKWFADKSFVCMPTDNIMGALKHIDTFEDFNIGLIGVDKNIPKITIYFNPKKEEPYACEMRSLLNERLIFSS